MPLNRLHVESVRHPTDWGQDALPIINFLKFPPEVEAAFQQVCCLLPRSAGSRTTSACSRAGASYQLHLCTARASGCPLTGASTHCPSSSSSDSLLKWRPLSSRCAVLCPALLHHISMQLGRCI